MEEKTSNAFLSISKAAALLSCMMVVSVLLVFFVYRTQHHHGPPNIVIFLADDLGYGDLGSYGHPTSLTPNLDRMAEEGLVFTQFYSGSPVCSPSRATLLTGRYAARSGIWPHLFFPNMTGGLPLNETTIAEVVSERGYSTSIVGKWHLGVGAEGVYLPTHQGFDEYLGVPYSHDMCPCCHCFYPEDACWKTCSRDDVPCPLFDGMDIVEQPVDLTTLAARFVQRATSFIRRNARASKPFFLYFPFLHPHYPQFAGREFRNTSRRGTYGDSLAEMDWSVGKVVRELRRMGVIDNTLVLFLSDNGPGLKEENRGGSSGLFKCGKGTTYEGGQRTPAIAFWPRRIAPGRTLALATSMDILPTISRLVEGTLPQVTLDGYDMAPILFEGKKGSRKDFAYYPEISWPQYGVFAIRHEEYKAHFYTKGSANSDILNSDLDCRPPPDVITPTLHDPPLLFNLDEDPGERYNLSTSEYASVLAEMERLKQHYDSTMEWGPSQILKPTRDDVEPCCDKGCSPFPQCCRCHNSVTATELWVPSTAAPSCGTEPSL